MRVRILKSIASTYGGFAVGSVTDIPEAIAQSWIKAGIAEPATTKRQGDMEVPAIHFTHTTVRETKPTAIPKGMFWCSQCKVPHRETSKIGKRHQKYSS